MKMNTDSPETDKQNNVATRMACGAFCVLLAAAGVAQIYSSPSSKDGWFSLLGALFPWGFYAFTYQRSKDTCYRVSKGKLVGIMAICTVPPLILLFCFGDRAGWMPWLLTYFFLSLGAGPLFLLRHSRQHPKEGTKSEGN